MANANDTSNEDEDDQSGSSAMADPEPKPVNLKLEVQRLIMRGMTWDQIISFLADLFQVEAIEAAMREAGVSEPLPTANDEAPSP